MQIIKFNSMQWVTSPIDHITQPELHGYLNIFAILNSFIKFKNGGGVTRIIHINSFLVKYLTRLAIGLPMF
jgi:hypothetical protein